MKNLSKILTLAAIVSVTSFSCTSNDDFSDIVSSSNLDAQTTGGIEDDEVAKPGSND